VQDLEELGSNVEILKMNKQVLAHFSKVWTQTGQNHQY